MSRNGYFATVPPAYTGVVFLFCWTYLLFYATSAGIEAAAPISLYSAAYTVSAAVMCLTLVVVSFAPIDRTALLTHKGVKAAVGVLLPVGTALLIAGSGSQNLALIIVAGVVTGVFSGLMLLQWIVAYQRVGLRVAAESFPLLMAMSVGICVTLMYLPRTVVGIAAIAFPLVSELLFHEVRKEPWPQLDVEAADVKDRPVNFILLLLPFAVFALSSGFLDFSSADNNYTFVFYAFGAFVPVIVAGVFVFIVDRERFLGVFVVPLSFLVAVCVPFLATGDGAQGAPFISIGELGIEVLIFVLPIGFAQFFSLDSLKTYALGRVVYVVMSGVGWYAAEFADRTFGLLLHSQVSLVIILIGIEVLAVCLIVAIVKAQKSIVAEEPASGASDRLEAADTPDAAEAPTPVTRAGVQNTMETNEDPPLLPTSPLPPTVPEGEPVIQEPDKQEVFARLCDEHGLSQRERDVFELLARGYTSPRIQKELYIAAGTVNYHARNIYAKLGVHSKQELILLVESALEE